MRGKENKQIVEDMMKILKELPEGTFITSYQLMTDAGYDVDTKTDDSILSDIHFALFEEAEKEGVVLDMSKHDGKFEGLPYVLDFEVKHPKATTKVKIDYFNFA